MRGSVQQLLGRLVPGEAATAHALGLERGLRKRGLAGGVYAEEIDPELARQARPLHDAPADAVEWRILHHPGRGAARLAAARGGRLALAVYAAPERRLQPGLGSGEHRSLDRERRELEALARSGAVALAASASLREPLREAGFERVEVVAPCADAAVAAAAPAPVLRRLLSDRRVNLLYAGPVDPAQRLEELLRLFTVYQRFVEPASRLMIAGDLGEHPGYFGALSRMADELRLDEVVFQHRPVPGDLRALYASAAVFLSLGRDSGAGRLREALRCGVPVVALDTGAAREQLAGGGVLVPEIRHAELAELVQRVVRDARLRQALAAARLRALTDLADDPVSRVLEILEAGGEAA